MRQLFIVANWKENSVNANEWFAQIINAEWNIENRSVIVCPPFTLLTKINQVVLEHQLPIKIGAQDISQFAKGAHTGEVSGEMLNEFTKYVIIGHSERRSMGESETIIFEKLKRAMENNLIPIVCVSEIEQVKSLSLKVKNEGEQLLIAYEPLQAIGSGNPDTPTHADEFAQDIKREFGEVSVLYGGSVNPDNVHSFTNQEHIDGVLVGGASLDAKSFSGIIQNA